MDQLTFCGPVQPATAPQKTFYLQDSLCADDITKCLSGHFFNNIQFLSSKYSILFSSENQKIFKCPLIDNMLLKMYALSKDISELSKLQVLYPVGMVKEFYTFPLLHPPLHLVNSRVFRLFCRFCFLCTGGIA